MRNFTDTRVKTVSENDCKRSWSGSANGLRFRCKMCGHRFIAGDKCRFIWANFEGSPTRTGNFFVCSNCDNGQDDDLRRRMAEIEEEGHRRFWWLVEDDSVLEQWT